MQIFIQVVFRQDPAQSNLFRYRSQLASDIAFLIQQTIKRLLRRADVQADLCFFVHICHKAQYFMTRLICNRKTLNTMPKVLSVCNFNKYNINGLHFLYERDLC